MADRILACVRGGLSATVKLERSAYVPGEKMLINAEVSNFSTKRVKGVEAFLQQVRNLSITIAVGNVERGSHCLECLGGFPNDYCLIHVFRMSSTPRAAAVAASAPAIRRLVSSAKAK